MKLTAKPPTRRELERIVLVTILTCGSLYGYYRGVDARDLQTLFTILASVGVFDSLRPIPRDKQQDDGDA